MTFVHLYLFASIELGFADKLLESFRRDFLKKAIHALFPCYCDLILHLVHGATEPYSYNALVSMTENLQVLCLRPSFVQMT